MPATGSENFDDKEEKKIPKFTLDLNNNEYDTPEEESPTEEKDDPLPFTFTASEYVISTPDDDPVKQKEAILTNNSSQLSSPNLQCVHEEFSSSVPNHLEETIPSFSVEATGSDPSDGTSLTYDSESEKDLGEGKEGKENLETDDESDQLQQSNEYDTEDDQDVQPIRKVPRRVRRNRVNCNACSPREVLKRVRTPNSILKGSQRYRVKPKSAITVLEYSTGGDENLDTILQTSPSKLQVSPRKRKYKQSESALVPTSPRTLTSMLASPRTVSAVIPYINPLTSLSRSSSDNCLFNKSKNKLSAKDIIFNKKLKYFKSLVETAIKSRKTYTILGHFPNIREAFRARGWLEKYHDIREEYPRPSKEDSKDDHMVSRLLRDAQVNLLWTMRGDTLDWKRISKNTLVSRFPRAYFTTKVGLCSHLQQIHWFSEPVHFPRCHNISSSEDLTDLCADFRLTACLSLLRYAVYGIDSSKVGFFHEDGKVPLCAVEFASRRCAEFLSCQMHEDIDMPAQVKIWDHQWDQFLTWYYQIVHHGESFQKASKSQIHAIYQCSKHTVEHSKKFWPQMHLDGFRNLWIVKPGAKSRGRGIQVMNKLEDIIQKITATNTNDPRFVVQKYIERPLLIYNTKFDIRQWFLVTSAYPLTVWMYKESYLRFCSQNYSLVNMHESVHLSNNAIQCKYQNGSRHRHLPDENMWDCYSFQAYLRTIGVADVWHKVIYPGMKDGIVGSLLASQDSFDHRKNCFELYGADFMLAQNFVPWLIEINSGPCMAASTSVTARLCAQVLEDVIKVVVDRREDKNADTGMFELIYKQTISPSQPYMGQNLTLRGFKMLPDLSPKLIRKSGKYWPKSGKRERVATKSLKQEQGFSFNDCTSEVYELLSKLQVQLMASRQSSPEYNEDEAPMLDKTQTIKETSVVKVEILPSTQLTPSSLHQDLAESVPDTQEDYVSSLDKVINVINNNYSTEFNNSSGNENLKTTRKVNTEKMKKRTKIENPAPIIQTVEEKNITQETTHQDTVKLLDTQNSSSDSNNDKISSNDELCREESAVKDNDDKIGSEKVEKPVDDTANDTMEEDESFKFELDENIDVYTDIAENNEDVEKGFEYFHTGTDKKKSKEKVKKSKRRKKTDENLELINEWKLKVSETRKSCKDLVNNLKLNTNLMRSKSIKYEADSNSQPMAIDHGVKRLNLPSENRKDNLIKALPAVRAAIKKQKLLHSAKPVTVPYSRTPPEIKSPVLYPKSPTHVKSASLTKSPSPKSPSPHFGFPSHSPVSGKSPFSSPHSSPRHSSSISIFPNIKPKKSPENLFAVGMSMKCFTNKEQMITA